MLVLSRKSQESVVVGGTSEIDRKLVVTVLEIKGARVRLGFDVPLDVPVHRMEIWNRICSNPGENNSTGDQRLQRQNESAAKPTIWRIVNQNEKLRQTALRWPDTIKSATRMRLPRCRGSSAASARKYQ